MARSWRWIRLLPLTAGVAPRLLAVLVVLPPMLAALVMLRRAFGALVVTAFTTLGA